MTNAYPANWPHQTIRASAGSGKTFQLSNRFLRLLYRGEPADTILATTFTRKAAGEILGRILERLAGAACHADKRAELSEHISDTGVGLTEDDALQMLGRVVRLMHRLSIATIDGLFNSIARSFAFELNIPFDAEMIDAAHPTAAALRARAIELMLAEDDVPTLLALLRRLHHDAAARSVTSAIDQIIQDLHEVYRQAPDPSQWAFMTPQGLLPDAELQDLIQRLTTCVDMLPEDKRWRKAYDESLAAALAHDWELLLKKGLAKPVAEEKATYYGKEFPPLLLDVLEPLVGHASAVLLERILDRHVASFQLLQQYERHDAKLRNEQSVMLFSDLTHKLARELPEIGPEVLTDVYFRLDSRFTHLMLDEFQDTSVDQWGVLHPIADEVCAVSDGSRSMLCVGDTKQAIYGWRGGCAELFDEIEHALPLSPQTLAKSWRSSQVVLDAVNEVFTGVSTSPVLEGTPQAAERFEAGYVAHAAAKELPGYVCLTTSPADAASHESYVAECVRALHQSDPGGTVGVLVATNSAAANMMFELKRLGLHVSGEGGGPLDETPAVEAVLAALTLAEHPGDRVAAFHVVRSPLGEALGLTSTQPSDVRAFAARLRAELLQQGCAGVLAGWVQRVAPACDDRSLRRMLQLVELAEQYRALSVLRPTGFVDFVRSRRVEAAEPAKIRVMTIHQSKGLEFGTVVLPELDKGYMDRFPVLTERESPVGPILRVWPEGNQARRATVPQWEAAHQQACEERRYGDLCALYVAMTRAEHALHMIVKPRGLTASGKPKALSKSPATILRQRLSLDFEESPDGGELLYERGDPFWFEQHASADTLLATPSSGEPLCLTFPEALRPTRSWDTASPSGLAHGQRVYAKDLLRLETETGGTAFGSLIHAWFEHVAWLDEPDAVPSDEALLEIAAAMDAADADQALPRFRTMLECPAIAAALSRGDAADLWRERTFAVHLGGELLRGQFDRVHLWRDAAGNVTRAKLLDFKTDRVENDDPTPLVERYRPQVEAYRAALMQMLGLDAAAVEAALLLVGAGETVEVV